jgi:queuosine biosynthesis protein QueD
LRFKKGTILWSVGISAGFSAAHYIPGHPKCGRLHGHNYKVELHVEFNKLNEMGFVLDFGDLKSALNEILKRLDHTLLNESVSKDYQPPSAEKIAAYLYYEVKKSTDLRNFNIKVRVYETPTSWAEYFEI